MNTETLAPDVGWEPSGHLSDVALSVAADGEEALLDAEMQGHLCSCDVCAMRLGRVALRSAAMAEVFAQAAARAEERAAAARAPDALAPVSPRARRKAPIFAAAAALTVAVLGVAPQVRELPWQVMHAWVVARKLAPSFVRLSAHALGRAWSGPVGPLSVLVWCMAIALVLMGFGIAKRASKKALVDGGRQ
jgi:putative exporter of polyketide antibiotics